MRKKQKSIIGEVRFDCKRDSFADLIESIVRTGIYVGDTITLESENGITCVIRIIK